MAFTKSTEDLVVHQKMADYPIEDGQYTVEDLKKELDRPVVALQRDLNKVVDELREETSAGNLGARKLDVNDNSGANIQEKIYELNRRMQDVALGSIPDGSITEWKLDEMLRNSLARKNGVLQENLNAEMISGRKIGSLEDVGDIRTTAKPIEADNYLLCDGSIVSKEDYPNIDTILNYQPANTTLIEKTSFSLRTITRAIYAKGITIVSAGSFGEYLFYKRDTDSKWLKSSLSTISSICFDGTYFYAASGGKTIYKSIDGVNWETITTMDVSNDWATIDYIDGYFYLTNDYGSSSTGGIIYRTTDLTTLDGTNKVKEGSSYRAYRKVEKINNKYFAYGDYRSQGGVMSVSNDGVTWTDVAINSNYTTWGSLLFDGDYYILIGTTINESPYVLTISKCHKDLDVGNKDNWSISIIDNVQTTSKDNPYKGILYKGYIIIAGKDGNIFILDKSNNIIKTINYGETGYNSESLVLLEKNDEVYFYYASGPSSTKFAEIKINNGYVLPELTNNIKEGYHYLKVGE
jgi:hypothetical protein